MDQNGRDREGEGSECSSSKIPASCSPSPSLVPPVTLAPTPESSAAATAASEGLGEGNNLLVVVTGGSKGIGRACVESFARRGARVLFTYCSDTAASRQVEQSFQPTGRVQGCWLDQGDFDSVRTFATEVDRWREGRLVNIVVNNAALGVATVSSYGGLPPSPAPTSTAGTRSEECAAARRQADEDVALMRVNALGPVWVTEALLPMMMSSSPATPAATVTTTTEAPAAAPKSSMVDGDGVGGDPNLSSLRSKTKTKKTVLYVGSVGGGSQSVFPGFRVADAMSKAAVAYACKYFAAQSRRQREKGDYTGNVAAACAASATTKAESDFGDPGAGIDFVCLCPGATLTDMFRASTLDRLEAKGPGELERFLRALPQGRLMLPEEVGEAVHWLCTSPAATMFHGAVIDASAGLAVRPGTLTEFTF